MKREKSKKLSEAVKAHQEIIRKERSLGNFKFYLNAANDDTAITVRRTSRLEKTLDDYRTCPQCKGFLRKGVITNTFPNVQVNNSKYPSN